MDFALGVMGLALVLIDLYLSLADFSFGMLDVTWVW